MEDLSRAVDERDYLYKILLIGDEAVGKSSLMLRFCQDQFPEYHDSTIGVDCLLRSLNILGKKILLQIWDPPPPNIFDWRSSYLASAHGVIILYDITKPESESLTRVKFWLNQVDRYGDSKAIISITGCKNDSSDSIHAGHEIENLAKRSE